MQNVLSFSIVILLQSDIFMLHALFLALGKTCSIVSQGVVGSVDIHE
jgi:hypothetical protein